MTDHEPCCDAAAAAARGWRAAEDDAAQARAGLRQARELIDHMDDQRRRDAVTRERLRQQHPEDHARMVERLGEAEYLLRRLVEHDTPEAADEARRFLGLPDDGEGT